MDGSFQKQSVLKNAKHGSLNSRQYINSKFVWSYVTGLVYLNLDDNKP